MEREVVAPDVLEVTAGDTRDRADVTLMRGFFFSREFNRTAEALRHGAERQKRSGRENEK